MTRRKLVIVAAAAPLAAAAPSSPQQILLLRRYQLRNSADNMGTSLGSYLERSRRPALERAGVTGIGFFNAFIAPDSPFYLALESYPSLAALEETTAKIAADKVYQSQRAALNKMPGLRYTRYSTQILRGFSGFPGVVTPADAKTPRLFELRTYESNSSQSLAEKIRMFNEGEIRIFKETGLNPVFFGETLYGENQPNLTYMLWYDDLAARDANWKKFTSHPDWAKLKATPGWSDAEIVSNISSSLLRGLPFSPIK